MTTTPDEPADAASALAGVNSNEPQNSGRSALGAVVGGERLRESPRLDGWDQQYRDVQQNLIYHVQQGATIEEAIDSVLLVLEEDARAALVELGVTILLDDLIRQGEVESG